MNKNKHITIGEFHARDLFEDWKNLICTSTESIDIFTPYLDDTIIDLLDGVVNDIQISIITCLDGDSLFQRGYQLNVLKELVEKGYSVNNLEGLHAKIIVVDNEKVSLGSQNFTRRGRRNKEAGMSSQTSFANSDLLITLANWKFQSKEISIEMLNELISYIEKNEEEISALKKMFDHDIASICAKFEKHDIKEHILNSQNYNSKFRFAQGEVILTRTVPPPNYDYYSFFAAEFNNLCKWIITEETGEVSDLDLIDYNYYPALNVNTMRMAFLRIHTSRITFMKEEFSMSKFNGYEISETIFELDFNFLKTKTKEHNIKVKLKNEMGYFIFHFLFDGIQFYLKKEKYSNKTIEKFAHKNLLLKEDEYLKFLKFLIEPAKFTTSINQPKNIETFLAEYQYKVGIIEFSDVPVLVFN